LDPDPFGINEWANETKREEFHWEVFDLCSFDSIGYSIVGK